MMELLRWAPEAQELMEEHGEPHLCPVCVHGYGVPLGALGGLDRYRCCSCGIVFDGGECGG